MESYNAFPPTNDIDIQSEKNTIVLLSDSYPVHFCLEAVNFAQELNIKLIKIPEG